MNERQFEWTVGNRARGEARPAITPVEMQRVLERLGRGCEGLAALTAAWPEVAPTAVASVGWVETFENGCVVIGVSDASAAHYLRQRAAGLTSALGCRVPGVRGVRVAYRPAGTNPCQPGQRSAPE
jgi:hypothetical protein